MHHRVDLAWSRNKDLPPHYIPAHLSCQPSTSLIYQFLKVFTTDMSRNRRGASSLVRQLRIDGVSNFLANIPLATADNDLGSMAGHFFSNGSTNALLEPVISATLPVKSNNVLAMQSS